MEANQILRTNLLDIIFEKRNKQYGAYELRKNYSKRTMKAMAITFSVVAALIVGSGFSQRSTKQEIVKEKEMVRLTILEEEKLPEVIPPEPPKATTPPEQVRTEKLTTIVIAKPEDNPEPIATQSDLENAKIATLSQDGVDEDMIATPPVMSGEGDTRGILETKKKEDEGPVTIVQVQAAFKGDWARFLERNLRADVPVDNGAPAAKHRVMIEFVVDVDGSISNVKALTSLGYGMEEEAMRVIRKAGKWTPAINNGYAVKAYRRQSITFDITASE